MRPCSSLVLLTGALLCVLSGHALAEESNPRVRPLHQLGLVCQEGRLPAILQNGWILGCGQEPETWIATSLQTEATRELSVPEGDWGLWNHGLLDLHGKTAHHFQGEDISLYPIASSPHAPLIGSEHNLVLSTRDGLEIMRIGSKKRERVQDAKPAPWTTPAIVNNSIFWSQIDRGHSRIWWRESPNQAVEVFAEGVENLTHVTASGHWIAWRGDSEVWLRDLNTMEDQSFQARVHTSDRLALSDGLVCWEQWSEGDIDIHCSNGLHLEREGHQKLGSLWNGWLLFHEGRHGLLYGPLQYTPQ